MSEKTLVIIAILGVVIAFLPVFKRVRKYIIMSCVALGGCVIAASNGFIFKNNMSLMGMADRTFGTGIMLSLVRIFPWKRAMTAIVLGGGIGLFALNNGLVVQLVYGIGHNVLRLIGLA